ncbi:Chromosome partition protein Smc [Carpediemonas membranifera]|uniref:Chromosome partition protein Smc n=1 Tax=Carpediemonas membranifera TaxID=201153 RepID=A0A8J6BD22_9EUKA|nr:Chromosome partition protein Smc [Carpediemonas membranifera]|eukprot:KAG9394932.1 Chromosome partition protein Smc [Carpediemonas membranifera]
MSDDTEGPFVEREELNDVKSLLIEHETKLATSLDENASLQRQNVQLMEVIEDKNREIEQLQDEIQSMDEQLIEYRRRLTSAQEAVKDRDVGLNQAIEQLQKAENDIRKANDTAWEKSKEHEDTIAAHHTLVRELEAVRRTVEAQSLIANNAVQHSEVCRDAVAGAVVDASRVEPGPLMDVVNELLETTKEADADADADREEYQAILGELTAQIAELNREQAIAQSQADELRAVAYQAETETAQAHAELEEKVRWLEAEQHASVGQMTAQYLEDSERIHDTVAKSLVDPTIVDPAAMPETLQAMVAVMQELDTEAQSDRDEFVQTVETLRVAVMEMRMEAVTSSQRSAVLAATTEQAQAELSELDGRVRELEGERDALQQEVEALRSASEDADAFSRELNEKVEENRSLQAQVTQLTQELESTERDAGVVEDTRRELEDEVKQSRIMIRDFIASHADLQARMNALQENLGDTVQAAVGGVVGDIASGVETQLAQDRQATHAAVRRLVESTVALRRDNDGLLAECDDLKRRLAEKDDEISQFHSYAVSKATIANNAVQHSEVCRDAVAGAVVDASRVEPGPLMDVVNELLETTKEADADADADREEYQAILGELTAQIAELNREQAIAQSQADELRAVAYQAETETAQAHAELEEKVRWLEAEQHVSTSQALVTAEHLDDSERLRESVSTALADTTSLDPGAMADALRVLTGTIQELEAEAQADRDEYSHLVTELRHSIVSVGQELSESVQHGESLAAAVEQAQAETLNAQIELANLDQRTHDLEDERDDLVRQVEMLKNASEDASAFSRELDQNSRENGELREQVAQLSKELDAVRHVVDDHATAAQDAMHHSEMFHGAIAGLGLTADGVDPSALMDVVTELVEAAREVDVDAEADRDEYEAVVSELKVQVTQLNRELADAFERMDEMRAVVSQAEKDTALAKDELEDMEAKVQRLEAEQQVSSGHARETVQWVNESERLHDAVAETVAETELLEPEAMTEIVESLLDAMKQLDAEAQADREASQEVVDELKRRVIAMNRELAMALEQNDEMRKAVGQAERDTTRAHDELSELDGRVRELEGERDALQQEVEALRSASEDADAFSRELNEKVEENRSLQAQVTQLTQELESTERDAGVVEDTRRELEDEVKQSRIMIRDFIASHADLQARMNALQENLGDTVQAAVGGVVGDIASGVETQLAQDRQATHAAVRRLVESTVALRRDNDGLLAECDDLKRRLAEKDDEIEELADEAREAQRELRNVQSSTDNLIREQRGMVSSDTVETLKRTIQQRERELEDTRRRVEELEEALSASQKEVDMLRDGRTGESARAADEIARLEGQLAETQAKLAQQDAAAAVEEIQKVASTVSTLSNSSATFARRYDDLLTSYESLKKEAADKIREFEKREAVMVDDLTFMKDLVLSATGSNADLATKTQKMYQENARLTQENKDLDDRVKKGESRLYDASQQIAKLQEEIGVLKAAADVVKGGAVVDKEHKAMMERMRAPSVTSSGPGAGGTGMAELGTLAMRMRMKAQAARSRAAQQ